MYPEIAAAGADPWQHYVMSGKKDGRDNGLHPAEDIFYAAGYLEMYPDIAETGIDPWRHYVLSGKKEGRDDGLHPKEDLFFPEGYLEMYQASISGITTYSSGGKRGAATASTLMEACSLPKATLKCTMMWQSQAKILGTIMLNMGKKKVGLMAVITKLITKL